MSYPPKYTNESTTIPALPQARCYAPRAYMLNTPRRRGANEIMRYGWHDLRPLDEAEYQYWQNHALPFGHSVIGA